MSDADLATLPFEEVCERLADGRGTPSGGSGAALGGALGASLVAMLARASAASPKAARHHKLLEAVAEGCDEARGRLLRLADEDAAAYAKVMRAMRLEDEDEAAREAKQAALTAAMKEATDTPLRIMEQLLEVIGYAKNAIETGIPAATPDGASGAELCRGALKSAAMLVRANLRRIDDEAYVKLARTRVDEMTYMGTRVCTNIESFVEDLLS